MIKLYNTNGWSQKQIRPYLLDIFTAIMQLEHKIPMLSGSIIWNEILKGEKDLWIIKEDNKFKSIALTKVMQNKYSDNILMIFDYAGSDLGIISEILQQMLDWAKKHNIKYVETTGREGWKKFLKPAGFKIKEITYLKEINHEF
ncbi:hypothetical protein [Bartonella sp. DGB1]|uniref:hypothetical protein n=1 Tax=Bartonella sp. DGB1 TaxID=3239807 RepID=UPI0035234574